MLLPGTGVWVTSKPGVPRRSLAQALRDAWQGWCGAWRSEPNLRLHVLFGAAIGFVGFWCRLSATEWIWLSVAVGLMMVMELVNTAIEGLVDLTVGGQAHPLARRVKDVAASSVLISAVLAVAIASLVFFPHLLSP